MNRRTGALVLGAGVAVSVVAVVAARSSAFAPPAQVTALHIAAALSFIAVGVYAWSRPQSGRVGVLMCAVGFAWFVPDLGFLPSSSAVTIAVIEGPLAFGVLGHLFVSFPSGYLRSGLDRIVVIVVYLWTSLGNLVTDTFFAPAQLPCDCAQNLLVLHRDAGGHTLAVNLHQIGNLLLAVVVLGVVIAHWIRATPPGRRVLFPVALAAGPIEVAIISLNAVGVLGSLDWLTSASAVLTPSAVTTLPIGFLWGLLRGRFSHGALGNLILELGAAGTRASARRLGRRAG
jgi:hypothetical protein